MEERDPLRRDIGIVPDRSRVHVRPVLWPPAIAVGRAWTTWILGIVALEFCTFLAKEPAWIGGRDKVSHPLWRRVWHLALLLGLVVVVAAVAGAIITVAQ
jgi:hypothetical protein